MCQTSSLQHVILMRYIALSFHTKSLKFRAFLHLYLQSTLVQSSHVSSAQYHSMTTVSDSVNLESE